MRRRLKNTTQRTLPCCFRASLLLAIIGCLSLNVPAQTPPSRDRSLNIVFIGNSITYGATLKNHTAEAPPNSAAAYLRKRKGIGEVNFSNQGVSGATTVDFLPATGTRFKSVVGAADVFYRDPHADLVFSLMLGTNDSAIEGPLGSPVAPEDYRMNLEAIIDKLLALYPRCRVLVNRPIWYSPNTYNGSRYLQEGLTRLQSYFPEIDTLIRHYASSHPGRVMQGDAKAFRFFKRHDKKYYTRENGHQGVFHLHPNRAGADRLGVFWGKALYRSGIVSR